MSFLGASHCLHVGLLLGLGCVCCALSVVFCNVCDFDANAVVGLFLLWEVCFGVLGGVSTGGCLNIFLGWALVCVQSLFTWSLSKFDCCFFWVRLLSWLRFEGELCGFSG